MLEFFRRYQKFLFIFITTVVVISFSFFGTYSIFTGHETKDAVAFQAVDGSEVYKSELNDLIHLLSFEETPFQDGVVEHDILGTEIASNLVDSYLTDLEPDFQGRLEKEKRYVPYSHPQANFLSAEQVWTYFAPDLKKAYDELRRENQAKSPQAFQARAKLYLAQKRFSADYLKYFLRYQEMQHGELTPDPELVRRDMALFGYHSIQDWFGPKFTTLTAKFIINAARIASSQGIKISRDEVLAAVVGNVHQNFKEQIRRNKENMIYDNFNDYFQSELRRLGMDQSRLLKAWEDVLLFRRLYNETSDSILVSDLPYKDFYRYMNEYADVELFKLPKELQTKNDREIARLEIYLSAVRDSKTKDNSLLPAKIRDLSEIQKIYPELIQKRYRIQYATCTKEELAAKSTLKATWSWELEEANFKKIADKFPELAAKKAATPEAREKQLDALDSKTRALIDAYSRAQIVDEHPEWLQELLSMKPLNEGVVQLREQGGKSPFQGIARRKELMQLLDSVPLNSQNPALQAYTQDKKNFYRIVVIERADKPELLTLKEALGDGTLDALLDKTLEASYPRQRAQKPAPFVKDNGEFKPFGEVKDLLVEGNFQELFQRLDRESSDLKERLPLYCNWDDKNEARSAVRFYNAMRESRERLQEKPESITEIVSSKDRAKDGDPLREQFMLIQAKERAIRGAELPPVDVEVALKTDPTKLSPVNYSMKSGPVFFKVLDKGTLSTDEALFEKVFEAKLVLGSELKGQYTRQLVLKMQQKKALSLQD